MRTPLALLMLCAAGCASPAPQHEARPHDVLLITIDTARADRFSYVAAGGPGTPHTDRLAEEGVGFVNAISPVPLTLPAHASLLTGRQPPSHSVRDNGRYRLPDEETTLAEVLRDSGFTTGAFVGAKVLDARYGLEQGFQTFDANIEAGGASPFRYYAERNGEEVVAAASRWLAEQGEGPVFLWVHLFEPHVPYRPPEPERSAHPSAYDGEIAYADRIVGQLLERWDGMRGLARTVVVLTSDHGEGLGEHDEPTHGVLVHDATLRVPLVIRSPGITREEAVTEPVHLIDVMPTVLALLGLPPRDGVQGRNLLPLLRGETVSWSPVSGYAESLYASLHHGCTPLIALREGRFKLVHGVANEMYDLVADPGEHHDLAPNERERSAEMEAVLRDLVSELTGVDAERVPLDEETRRQLESLGYVWSSPAPPAEGEARCDPRDALLSVKRMAAADRLARGGDVPGAIAAYRTVIAGEPRNVDARVRLAHILVARKRGPEAVGLLEEAVAIAPHEPDVHYELGLARERLGDVEAALSTYEQGLALHPDNLGLRDARWRCLDRLDRRDELLAEVERAIETNPGDGMARYFRVLACCARGTAEDYRAALERELSELPGDPILEAALAGP